MGVILKEEAVYVDRSSLVAGVDPEFDAPPSEEEVVSMVEGAGMLYSAMTSTPTPPERVYKTRPRKWSPPRIPEAKTIPLGGWKAHWDYYLEEASPRVEPGFTCVAVHEVLRYGE